MNQSLRVCLYLKGQATPMSSRLLTRKLLIILFLFCIHNVELGGLGGYGCCKGGGSITKSVLLMIFLLVGKAWGSGLT